MVGQYWINLLLIDILISCICNYNFSKINTTNKKEDCLTLTQKKMKGKYISPNLFNNRAGNSVNIPVLFQAWLNKEY